MSHKCKIKNDDPELKGCRSTNSNHRLRRVRGDKYGVTIEEQYNVNFGKRSDIHLSTLLEENNVSSQTQLIKKFKENK